MWLCKDVHVFGRALPQNIMTTTLSIPKKYSEQSLHNMTD